MKNRLPKIYARLLIIGFFCFTISCSLSSQRRENGADDERATAVVEAVPKPFVTPTLIEILDNRDSKTPSPIGEYDFSNHSYPLPRGWQDRDGGNLTLVDGVRQVSKEKIGASLLTTKFGNVAGDDRDEAFVILKVETGGSAIPQIVYIFEWKEERPNLIWHFRTGDRAKGGLKRIYAEDGEMVVELFGRDRYIFTQLETSKIVGDEQDLCCPSHFTRTRYQKSGDGFRLIGDRWTHSLIDPDTEPIKNQNELKLKGERETKK